MEATISIPIDFALARVYNDASPEDQHKVQALLSLWLREMANPAPESLGNLMDVISDRAKARGLTPDILDQLLHNDE